MFLVINHNITASQPHPSVQAPRASVQCGGGEGHPLLSGWGQGQGWALEGGGGLAHLCPETARACVSQGALAVELHRMAPAWEAEESGRK